MVAEIHKTATPIIIRKMLSAPVIQTREKGNSTRGVDSIDDHLPKKEARTALRDGNHG